MCLIYRFLRIKPLTHPSGKKWRTNKQQTAKTCTNPTLLGVILLLPEFHSYSPKEILHPDSPHPLYFYGIPSCLFLFCQSAIVFYRGCRVQVHLFTTCTVYYKDSTCPIHVYFFIMSKRIRIDSDVIGKVGEDAPIDTLIDNTHSSIISYSHNLHVLTYLVLKVNKWKDVQSAQLLWTSRRSKQCVVLLMGILDTQWWLFICHFF
jgi:hypothetical protein